VAVFRLQCLMLHLFGFESGLSMNAKPCLAETNMPFHVAGTWVHGRGAGV
jgi:hypothetical protein